jgi:opacity protein-like surface antigen
MIKMDLRRVFISLAALSLSQGMHAQNSTWYMGMNLGGMKPSLPSAILVNNGSNLAFPNDVDRYSTHESSALFLSAIAGRFWQRSSRMLPGYALGLKYQHLFSNTIHGQVMQYSVPKFINYDYAWNVSVDTLSAYSKLELIRLGIVIPYVIGGLGVAMNHSYGYHERALPGIFARDNPGFGSHTQSNLAYDLGLGIDIALKPELMFSLGYSYQHLGSVHSGQGLRFPPLDMNLNANALFAGMTYLFDKKNNVTK